MASVKIKNLLDTLTSTLWFVPGSITVGAGVMAFWAIWLDRVLFLEDAPSFLYSGGPEGARAVLSTTAGSMITVAGVAFSMTMVAFSFASSQLGPRLIGNFMRDRGNQVVLGTFIGTFVYCILVLRTVSEKPARFVPHIGVSVGLVLAVLSLGVLIYFIHHTALALQADHVIGLVGRELDHSIKHLYPGSMGEGGATARTDEFKRQEAQFRDADVAAVSLEASGYVKTLEVDRLMKVATKHDLVIRILSRPGRYAHDGIPVAQIRPPHRASEEVKEEVAQAFVTAWTRNSQQDVEFAVNQMVEVAVRALSPGINDPFTAITCIDRLTTAILHLMRTEFPSRFRVDGEGRLRVIADRPDFKGVVDAAFHQIRQTGAQLPAVMIRLLEALTLLLEQAKTDQQRRALERHIELVRSAGVRETEEPEDREDMNDRVSEAAAAGGEERQRPA